VAVFVELYRKQRRLTQQERMLRDAELREVELRHRAELLETQAQMASELRGLNEELSARQAELERAMTARNRFYASMSHELRTPINAIIGYNTLLLDNIYGPLNDKQVHGIQRAHKAAKHLLELVNDVLDLSKIEAGKIELTVQPVSVPALIEDLLVTVRPLADEHRVTLELHCEGELRPIASDPRRVRQILLNLLSNAIKFGDGKPVRVVVRMDAEGALIVGVTDHGAGIASDDLPRIFDEFVQLSNSQRFGGTGLGLPISKRLANIMGGDLSVESEPGNGSTFTLVLPLRPDDHAAPALEGRNGSAVDDVATPVPVVAEPAPRGGVTERTGASRSTGLNAGERR
jgi:signal transduction histidine kinase